jgi:hypothetical protein
MLKILSLGITIIVSTASFIFCNHSIAFIILLFPSKEKGLVTTPTVKIPISLAAAAITGAAQVQVPPPIPAVTNTISVSCKAFLISSIFSSAALLQISGLAPAPNHLVILKPIFIFLSAKLLAKT